MVSLAPDSIANPIARDCSAASPPVLLIDVFMY